MIRTAHCPVIAALALALAWVVSSSALAQTPEKGSSRIVCWKDKSGKIIGCGDKVPLEYQDSATREIDRRGVTRSTTESAEEAAKRRAREEEAARAKAEQAKRLAEQKRQDDALLSTFSNEKEIDQKRDRDLAQTDLQLAQLKDSLKNATERYNEAKTRSEAAATKDPKNAELLKEDMNRSAADRKRLEQSIAAKEKEKEEIRQRYADQKKRYLELRGESPSAGAAPAGSPTAQKPADQGKGTKGATTKDQVSDAIKQNVPKGLVRDNDPTAAK